MLNGSTGDKWSMTLNRVWRSMFRRCAGLGTPGKNDCYVRNGISVCDEWKEFETFRRWSANNGFVVGLSIDRIDSLGNYAPDNCQWIPMSENIAKRNRENPRKRRV